MCKSRLKKWSADGLSGKAEMSASLSASVPDPKVTATSDGHLNAPILIAENLGKSFGATQALRRADLRCYPGEVHALLGANGAGKSTLVNILSGRMSPDAGTVELSSTGAQMRARALGTDQGSARRGLLQSRSRTKSKRRHGRSYRRLQRQPEN